MFLIHFHILQIIYLMMNSKIIEIERIGPVLFAYSSRAKRISISIKNTKEIRVAVPFNASLKSALKFVKVKENWIQRHLLKLNSESKIYLSKELKNKEESSTFIKNRLFELSHKYGFHFKKVTIRNQKTRWGSCSQKNNINLNINLIQIPENLMDYVIIHELVHTVVKNHSYKFWNLLDQYIPNSRHVDKELKKFVLPK